MPSLSDPLSRRPLDWSEADVFSLLPRAATAPEPERLQIAQGVDAYFRHYEARGLDPTPRASMAIRSSLWDVIDNPETLDGSQSVRLAKALGADVEEARALEQQITWLSAEYGKGREEVAKARELYAADYAKKNWGEPRDTEPKAFAGRVKPIVAKRRQEHEDAVMISEAAVRDAAQGRPMAGSLAELKAGLATTPASASQYVRAYSDAAAKLAPLRPLINAFAESPGGLMRSSPERDALRDALLGLPRDVRQLAASAAHEASKKKGEGAEAGGFLAGAGKGLERTFFGAPDMAKEERALFMVPSKAGDKVRADIPAITTAEDAAKWVEKWKAEELGKDQAGSMGPGQGGGAFGSLFDDGRELTEAEAALMTEAVKRRAEQFNVDRELTAAANEADPIKGYIAQTGGVLGTSLAISGLSIATRGAITPQLADIYARNNYSELRLAHPDMSPDEARTAAGIAGMAEAALDLVPIKLWDRLSNTAALFKAGAHREGAKALAKDFGISFAGENVQEGLQDAMLPLIKHAVAADVPSLDWGRDIDQFIGGRADVALGLLPLTMLGLGVATIRDVARNADPLFHEAALRQMGFGSEDRMAIIDAEITQGTEAAVPVFREAMGRRDPAVSAEAVEALNAKAAMFEQQLSTLASQGIAIERKGDAWTVTTRGGRAVQVDSHEAARVLAEDLGQAHTIEEAEELAHVFEQLSRGTGEGGSITATGESQRIRGRRLVGVEADGSNSRIIDDPKKLDAILSEARSMGVSAEGLQINGSNDVFRNEVGETAARLVINRSEAQTTVQTALHEGLEQAHQRFGSTQETLDALRVVHAIGVDAGLDTDQSEDGELLRRIDDAVSGRLDAAGIREVFIEIGVGEWIARDKRGQSTGFKPGTLTRLLNERAANSHDPAELGVIARVKQWLEAVRRFLRGVAGVVGAVQGAREKGEIADDNALDAYMEKLIGHATGTLAERRFEREAVAAAESSGQGFSMSRATPADASQQTELADGSLLVGPTTFSITAFHGTPHEVDRFRLDRVGTGEGAQAFGWGLYFAENRSISEWYRDNTESEEMKALGRAAQDAFLNANSDLQRAADAMGPGESYHDAYNRLARLPEFSDRMAEAARALQAYKESRGGGHLYSVELLVEAERLLDHDAAFSKQPDIVREALRGLAQPGGLLERDMRSDRSGAALLMSLQADLGDDARAASQALAAAGVPGLRYLDHGSRPGQMRGYEVERPTHNFVIFDEALVRIIERDGQAVPRAELIEEPARELLELAEGLDLDEFLGRLEAEGETPADVIARAREMVADGQSEGGVGFSLSRAPVPSVLRPALTSASVATDEVRNPSNLFKALTGRDARPARQAAGTDAPKRGKHGGRIASGGDVARRLPALEVGEFTQNWVNVGGGEHAVFYDDVSGRVVKITKAGLFGYHAEDAGAYVQRWALHNELLGDGVTIEGTLPGENGEPRMVISQPFVDGRDSTDEEVANHLKGKGFVEHDGDWVHPIIGVTVRDTRTKGNAITREDGTVQPVDWVVEPTDRAALREVREKSGFGRETAFSLSPASRVDLMRNRVDLMLPADSKAGAELVGKAKRNLDRLRDSVAALPKSKSRAELDRGQRELVEERRAQLEARLVGQVEAEFQHLGYAPAKVMDHPLAQFVMRKRGRMVRGKMMPPSVWRVQKMAEMSEGRLDSIPGDYDGAADLPRWVFGGRDGVDSPDLVVQSILEAQRRGDLSQRVLPDDATAADLWPAIGRMLDEVSTAKAEMAKYRARLQAAREAARQEAEFEGRAWRAEQDAAQDRLGTPRDAAIRDLATVEAVARVLPPEVREKLGTGWTNVAGMVGDKEFTARITELISRVDVELTRHWKRKNRESLDELLALGQGKKEPGKKRRGTATPEVHAYFADVARVVDVPEKDAAGFLAMVQTNLVNAEAQEDHEAEERNARLLGVAQQWGAFDEMSPAEQERALAVGWETYRAGRNAWWQSEEARLRGVRERAQRVIAGNGSGLADLTQTRAKGGVARVLDGITREVTDIGQFLRRVLGDDALADEYDKRLQDDFQRKEVELSKLRQRWEAALAEALPGRSKVQRERRFHELLTKRVIRVDISQEQLNALLNAKGRMEAMATGWEPPRVDGVAALTEDEALSVVLTWAQPRYRASLERTGFTQQSVRELEAKISPEAQHMRRFMRGELDAHHPRLNGVFRVVGGIDLPNSPNYWPGRFYSAGAERDSLDVMGAGFVGGGFAEGFLKERKDHAAFFKLRGAFETFWGHMNQSTHWVNLAETTREIRGVIRNPQVKFALESRHGEGAVNDLTAWLDALEANGVKASNGEIDGFLGWLLGRFSVGRLAWNAFTVARQSSAMFNVGLSGDLSPGMLFAGAGSIMRNGPLAYRDIFDELFGSDEMQARLYGGHSPEVKNALNQFWSAGPGLWRAVTDKGMEINGYADAIFTSLGGVVAYEAHAIELEEAGVGPVEAHKLAIAKAKAAMLETAQPNTLNRRSLAEARATNAVSKSAMSFLSDGRQKLAIYQESVLDVLQNLRPWKGQYPSKRSWNRLLWWWGVVGPASQIVASAIRDFSDTDDDEWFDEKNWNWRDFVVSSAVGPFRGLWILGNAVDYLANRWVGRSSFSSTGGVADIPEQIIDDGLRLAGYLTDDKDQTDEQYFKVTLELMSDIGGPLGMVAGWLRKGAKAKEHVEE